MSATIPPGQQATLAEACELAQNGSDGDESDGGPETAQDTPDCHHEPVWYESGTCMACEPAGRGSEERNVERELTRDAAGGVLP